MSEIILDSAIDSIKLLPFLFLTYLFMEWLEHKTGSAARNRIRTAGKLGPVWGGLLGVIPQCGFSAAASSLFSGRVITVGTLIAVYLSTSDEMFPIMISNAVPVVTIVKILTCKAVIGILSGLVLEYVYTHILKKQEPDVDIHEICEEERCHCEHGVISSAAFHTLKVFVYIFLISLVLNIIIGLAGEETLAGAGVSYCATCDGAFFRNKTVAVVGGGDVALEDALYLAAGCEKVYLIHRRQELRGTKVLQEQVANEPKITFLPDTVVKEICGEQMVDHLVLANTGTGEEKELPVSGIFIAVGMNPQTDAVASVLDLDHGYVRAGEDGVTEQPGLFVAGDVRTKKLRQIVTAVADGANSVTSIVEYLKTL